MARRIPIQLHVANALQWQGTLYRSPADALKEHVSNAIDEHLKAQLDGTAHDRCLVTLTLDRRQVVLGYPYGMSRKEFEAALQRVADSAKRASGAHAIGRLGIGIFGFQQIGRKCTFYSRKTVAGETLRVVLKEGSDTASIETALARDRLEEPGLRVVISDLKVDPTRSRGPLAPETLRRYLGEKFETYLREGWDSRWCRPVGGRSAAREAAEASGRSLALGAARGWREGRWSRTLLRPIRERPRRHPAAGRDGRPGSAPRSRLCQWRTASRRCCIGCGRCWCAGAGTDWPTWCRWMRPTSAVRSRGWQAAGPGARRC